MKQEKDTFEQEKRELEQEKRELEERARQIRLQEIELEINKKQSDDVYETSKYNQPEKKKNSQLKKLIKVGKFLGIVVAVVAAVYISFWLAATVLVVGIAWIGYKILFEKDK